MEQVVYPTAVFHTKALYNLLRFNVRTDPSIPHEPWAIEDLRTAPLEDLFARLGKKGIPIDRKTYIHFAEDSDTPEALTEILLADSVDEKAHDPIYLILFELWRRLLPEKPALTIFCDELDHQIDRYDQEELESDEPIQDILANLQAILDENRDIGGEPRDLFASLEEDCAHDIESFLYDYISELLDAKNVLYASELLEGFSPYIPEPIWFEILRARLLSFSDIAEASQLIMEILKQNPTLSQLIAILRLLSTTGDRTLFVSTVQQAIPLLETEEEFLEILSVAANYYRLLDLDPLEQAIQTLIQKRKGAPERIHPADLDIKYFINTIY